MTMHAVHLTASTTISRMMTGKFGVLMVNGEEEVQEFMSKFMTCKKSRLLHYISPVGMTDTRMMPTVHPFAMIGVHPIPSWPIVLSEENIKKLPFLIIMCRQTGFVWHKILYDWTAKSITMALLMLQYRFGKIENIVSDKGANLIPKSINPSVVVM